MGSPNLGPYEAQKNRVVRILYTKLECGKCTAYYLVRSRMTLLEASKVLNKARGGVNFQTLTSLEQRGKG